MSDEFKKCPDCAEVVRAEARKCRFCGYDFIASKSYDGPLPDPVPSSESLAKEPVAAFTRPERAHVAPDPNADEAARKNKKALWWILGGIVGFFFLIGVINSGSNQKPGAASSATDATAAADAASNATAEADNAMNAAMAAADAAANAVEKPTAQGSWDYNTQRDEARGADIKFASVTSENEVYLSAPYGGGTRARMTIRQHPQYGLDIYFTVSPAQLLCNSYDGCTALINIDGKAHRVSLTEPADHDSEVVFVSNASSLLSKLKGSKKVIVELTVYQNGNPQWTFKTDGLEWPKK